MEFYKIPALVSQTIDGFPQSFKLEVPEYSILRRMPDALRTEQHCFKRTFTQMPLVPFLLRLFPSPILLQKVRGLLWH